VSLLLALNFVSSR